MTIHFALTAKDLGRLQKIVARRFRRRNGALGLQFGLRVLVWVSIGLAVATYTRLMHQYPEISTPLWTVAVLLVVAFLAVLALPYLAQVSLSKQILAPNGAFLSPQTISLLPKSLQVSSATGTTEIPWSGLLAREEDKFNYYLFVDEAQALVLPKDAVAPYAAEFDEYTAHIHSAA